MARPLRGTFAKEDARCSPPKPLVKTKLLLHWLINADGMSNKLDDLRIRVKLASELGSRPHIISICESHLDDSSAKMSIDGYSPFARHRNAHGGGILVFALASLNALEVDNPGGKLKSEHEV